jgi:hypothetical protein
MRRLTSALIVLAAVAIAPPALAYVHVGTSCADGVVTCYVGIFNDGYNDGYDCQGVILQWRHLNACDEAWSPVDMEPLPLGPLYEHVSHTLTFPAHDPDEWVDYRAFFIDPAGDLHPAPGGGWWSSDEATCANPVLSRGHLVQQPYDLVYVEPCPDTCWFGPAQVFTEELEPGTWEDLVNAEVAVDIYGYYRDDEMPGASGIHPTAIAPLPAGEPCAPAVSTAPVTWSTVKSLYR